MASLSVLPVVVEVVAAAAEEEEEVVDNEAIPSSDGCGDGRFVCTMYISVHYCCHSLELL